jgi:predicted amidohydrolase YtcJ
MNKADLVLRGGVIAAVGTDAQIDGLTGPGTQVIELAGRMLLPGFIDAHVHASAAGLERLRCDLSGAHGLDDYLTIVRRYAEASPDAGWITGCGWAMDVFPGGVASRHDLDRVVPDRPVPVEPGSPRRVGEQQGAGTGRGHRQHA